TRLNTLHIAYIHSPMRFVWDYNEKYLKEERQTKWNFLARPILNYIRLWDYLAADRPDYLIANSQYTQERIKKYYRKESKIIYPPCSIKGKTVSILKTNSSKPFKRYFLIVSRLSAYKNIEIVVKAFNRLQLPLVIAGEGKESRRLKKIAKKNVKFIGWVAEDKLVQLYLGARAFIFPSLDDFGIAPVEAMGWGVPVLALKKGGAKEIVEEGKTGEFFKTAEAKAIMETLKKFMQNEDKYDKNYIRQSAQKFNSERFKKELTHFIENLYN
ncbi:MAG TPA: glycosyltransferase, partial [Candidatus Moranbacteria bacterium]|nr:glycosyltransferase [Candidatus Moranbacteria bacterium]